MLVTNIHGLHVGPTESKRRSIDPALSRGIGASRMEAPDTNWEVSAFGSDRITPDLSTQRERVDNADEAAHQLAEAITKLSEIRPEMSSEARSDIVGLLALVLEDVWELQGSDGLRLFGNMLAVVEGM